VSIPSANCEKSLRISLDVGRRCLIGAKTRVLLILALLTAWSSAQEFKDGGRFSPYGPSSAEVNAILSRASADANVLRELSSRPLEDTYEALVVALGSSDRFDPRYKPLVPVAKDILFTHPDFENFMQRTLRKMVTLSNRDGKMPTTTDGALDYKALLARPQIKRSPEEEKQFQISERLWLAVIGIVQNHPSPEMRIRLLGPCLEFSDYWYETGDEFRRGPANIVTGILAGAVQKATGEGIPLSKNGYSYDVEIAREWWRKNEAKYKWTPPAAQPAAVVPSGPLPTPIPKRILPSQNRKPDGSKDGERNDVTSAGSGEAGNGDVSSMRYWFIGGALLLAAIGALARARNRRRVRR